MSSVFFESKFIIDKKMSKRVIKVENISKEYRLGEVGSGTISRDINAWWAKVRGYENPNLRISDVASTTDSSSVHHALKNVSFTVN